MCQPEDWCTLPLGVGMNGVWLHLRFVLRHKIQDVVTFPGTAGSESREKSDIVIRNKIVANTAITAVSDVIFRHQILGIKIPFRTIGRPCFTESPKFLQREVSIGVNDSNYCLIKLLLGDVSLIDEGNLPSVYQVD